MKTGDTIELIEDISFYKRGKKAHFIRVSNRNSNNIEIVWFGEEHAYKEFGDVDEYPIKLFKKVYAE
jgi:hypothetical protein